LGTKVVISRLFLRSLRKGSIPGASTIFCMFSRCAVILATPKAETEAETHPRDRKSTFRELFSRVTLGFAAPC
jgi:hypothetical protein